MSGIGSYGLWLSFECERSSSIWVAALSVACTGSGQIIRPREGDGRQCR
jgi:hypothetical protein